LGGIFVVVINAHVGHTVTEFSNIS